MTLYNSAICSKKYIFLLVHFIVLKSAIHPAYLFVLVANLGV